MLSLINWNDMTGATTDPGIAFIYVYLYVCVIVMKIIFYR